MKSIFVLIGLIFSTLSFAVENELHIGCISGIRVCIPSKDNACKYVWMYEQMGGLYQVILSKSGTGPGYEMWRGNIEGERNGTPFQLSISQKRSSADAINFLELQTTYDHSTVTASGLNVVQASIVDENQKGIAIRCDSTIVPVPE